MSLPDGESYKFETPSGRICFFDAVVRALMFSIVGDPQNMIPVAGVQGVW